MAPLPAGELLGPRNVSADMPTLFHSPPTLESGSVRDEARQEVGRVEVNGGKEAGERVEEEAGEAVC